MSDAPGPLVDRPYRVWMNGNEEVARMDKFNNVTFPGGLSSTVQCAPPPEVPVSNDVLVFAGYGIAFLAAIFHMYVRMAKLERETKAFWFSMRGGK